MAATLYQPQPSENTPIRKPLVGFVFGAICVAGMVAVFRPMPCSNAISCTGKNRATINYPMEQSARKKFNLLGHHPDCGKFTAHVFKIRSKTLCAGCTGLFLGGLSALIGSLVYFFTDLPLGQAGPFLLWAGAVGTVLGLLQSIFFSVPWSSVRTFINAFFAFGTFLLLVAVDYIAQSVYVDMFLVLLTVFWLFTKISLSRLGHGVICRECKVSDCDLRGF